MRKDMIAGLIGEVAAPEAGIPRLEYGLIRYEISPTPVPNRASKLATVADFRSASELETEIVVIIPRAELKRDRDIWYFLKFS